jgi:hypothetical protein
VTTTVVPLNNPEGHYRASGSLRSEWTKLHTVRSTVWTLVTLVVASIGVSILACAETASHWATMSAVDKVGYHPTNLSLSGFAPDAVLGQPGVLRAVVLAGVYVAGLGLVALGLGAIIRHTAGAISALVGLLFIVPLILKALPDSIDNSLSQYFPSDVGSAMASVHQQAHTLSPLAALGVLCAYAVVALGIGGWLMVRRDA